jgi:hypothetical protein
VLVYNLSKKELYYRGRPIPANGGSLEYPDMKYVPTRDMKLQDDKVLAFGQLPTWWKFEQEAKAGAEAKRLEGLKAQEKKIEEYKAAKKEEVLPKAMKPPDEAPAEEKPKDSSKRK